jgi:hypothetical protein
MDESWEGKQHKLMHVCHRKYFAGNPMKKIIVRPEMLCSVGMDSSRTMPADGISFDVAK